MNNKLRLTFLPNKDKMLVKYNKETYKLPIKYVEQIYPTKV